MRDHGVKPLLNMLFLRRFSSSLLGSAAGALVTALLVGFAHSPEGAKIGAALATALHDAIHWVQS